MIQKVETDHSVWVFDSDSMMVTRMPKTEDISHPGLDYRSVGKPRSFESATRVGPRIRVELHNMDIVFTGDTESSFEDIGV